MNTVNENALEFMKSELKKAQIGLSQKESGREAVDFNIKINNGKSYQLFFKSINANAIPELSKYALENMIDKLKVK